MNLFDPSAVLASPCIPKQLENQYDAIVAVLHAAMAAVSFRLIGVDDSASPVSDLNNVLPDGWNAHSGSYTLVYKHDQSTLQFVVKLSKLGSRTIIHAIALESEKAASLDINTNDFTSASFWPYNALADNAQPLVHGFISSNRVADLLSKFKSQIIQKLVPGLHKEGYKEEDISSSSSSASAPPARGNYQPSAQRQPPPTREVQPPPMFPGGHNPYEIGRSDLDPFPSNGFAPPTMFPGGGEGGGMYVGPNHPIFGVGGRPGRGEFGQQGPWGGDGYLPPMGAPPGARFDPVGPGFGTGGFGGFGGRRGGRGGHGPLGGPDNDEFLPPGNGGPGNFRDDMFS